MVIELAPRQNETITRPIGTGLAWVLQHQREIIPKLEAERNYLDIRGCERYDTENRLLSEMGVCHWYSSYGIYKYGNPLPLPYGYTLIDGQVTIRDPDTGEIIYENVPHEFFQKVHPNGRRTILCLTAAQFTYPTGYANDANDMPEYKGLGISRIRARLRSAGREDMYTILSDELAVLEGDAEEISDILGLTYQDSPPPPSDDPFIPDPWMY